MKAYRTRRTSRDPLRHASNGQPASRTGKNVLAECGASVAVELPDPFDPAHPRACTTCTAIVLVSK